jgi:hypothetical protein
MNQQLYQQQEARANTLAADYKNLLTNPGYTPAQRSAINNQSLGALASAFAALATNAANRAARTRNAAGFGSFLSELGREQARQAGSLAQRNEAAFAGQAQRDRLAALEGLSGLYGVDATLLGRALGLPSDLLNVRQSASRGSGGFRFGVGLPGFGGISLGYGG